MSEWRCAECGAVSTVTTWRGPRPTFCGQVCKQRAYRRRRGSAVTSIDVDTRNTVTTLLGITSFGLRGPTWSSLAWSIRPRAACPSYPFGGGAVTSARVLVTSSEAGDSHGE